MGGMRVPRIIFSIRCIVVVRRAVAAADVFDFGEFGHGAERNPKSQPGKPQREAGGNGGHQVMSPGSPPAGVASRVAEPVEWSCFAEFSLLLSDTVARRPCHVGGLVWLCSVELIFVRKMGSEKFNPSLFHINRRESFGM